MTVSEITNREITNKKAALKKYRHDSGTVFFAASLLIGILYLSEPFTFLTDTLSRGTAAERFFSSPVYYESVSVFFYLLSMIIPAMLIRSVANVKVTPIFPVTEKPAKRPGSFLFLSLGIGWSVNLVCNLLLSDFYPVISSFGNFDKTEMIFDIISAVILAPIFEEMLFRGVILRTLSYYGGTSAIFVSALIFGLVHRNPPSVINAFVLGICIAIAYMKTNSVRICILMHFANNAFAIFASLIVTDIRGTYIAYALSVCCFILIAFALATVAKSLVSEFVSPFDFDDVRTDFPRMRKKEVLFMILQNPWFWIFIAVISYCVVRLYIG